MKLTSVDIKNRINPHIESDVPFAAPSPDPSEHLICLSSKEALMLFQLLQASMLHPPMREGLLGQSEYSLFHRQLSGALGSALGGRPQARSIPANGNAP